LNEKEEPHVNAAPKNLSKIRFQQPVFRFLPQMFYGLFLDLPGTFPGYADRGSDFFE
jgi:hypothetical protein